jgi:hypothetical protein
MVMVNEMSALPEAQEIIELKNREKLEYDQAAANADISIERLNNRKDILIERMSKLSRESYTLIASSREEYRNEINRINMLYDTVYAEFYVLEQGIRQINENLLFEKAEIRRRYKKMINDTIGRGANHVCKCPVDDCRGFVLNNMECGTCNTVICNNCRNIKVDGHECNSDDVKTVDAINKDSKPCPKCATIIYKIDGCDQMWCVSCHTAFSWNTGIIDNGQIHAPDYYQYIRQTNGEMPRNPIDKLNIFLIMYRRMIDGNDNTRRISGIDNDILKNIRFTLLFYYDTTHRLNEDDIMTRINMRIKYLQKKYTEQTWKQKLFLYLRKIEMNMLMENEISKFIDEIIDISRQYCDHTIMSLEIPIRDLRININSKLYKISTLIGLKTHIVF